MLWKASTITIDDPLDMEGLKKKFIVVWLALACFEIGTGNKFPFKKILFAIEWRNENVIGNG